MQTEAHTASELGDIRTAGKQTPLALLLADGPQFSELIGQPSDRGLMLPALAERNRDRVEERLFWAATPSTSDTAGPTIKRMRALLRQATRSASPRRAGRIADLGTFGRWDAGTLGRWDAGFTMAAAGFAMAAAWRLDRAAARAREFAMVRP